MNQDQNKTEKMMIDNLLCQYNESKRIITQAKNDHQLVTFVGAGASVASGMPLWEQAVKNIANRLSIYDKDLDYLRIPQYYYNARGKKEYTQLMREIFRHGDYLPKHEIHDRVIEFDTETIITTNYDHLIEHAAEDSSQILSVVSKDTDLPYRHGGKELIKMHGDFENDNFVLKEDDYLRYSRNFKLIENYVKSLIGTKVVLFIGYAFNDPDLKLIFSWVKDILLRIYRPKLERSEGEPGDNYYTVMKSEGIDEYQYNFIREKLARLGMTSSENEERRDKNLDKIGETLTEFLKQIGSKNPKPVKPPKLEKISRSDNYSITPLGRQFLKFIDNPE